MRIATPALFNYIKNPHDRDLARYAYPYSVS